MLNTKTANNEADLYLYHEDIPIFITALKTSVKIGHFVIFTHLVALGPMERTVRQIIKRRDTNEENIVVCLYLPLFHKDTLLCIGSPSALP